MLSKKLKLKENTEIIALNAPASYKAALGDIPEGVTIKKELKSGHEFIHLFVKNKAELDRQIPATVKALKPGGLLWISYPKTSSGMQTDLSRDKGWNILEKMNLKWMSMIAFDENWSAFLLKNEVQTTSRASAAYHDNVAKFVDTVNKTVTVPGELQLELKKHKKAANFFNTLSFSNKKEYVIWIVSAKQETTKNERIKKTIDKLTAGKKNPAEK